MNDDKLTQAIYHEAKLNAWTHIEYLRALKVVDDALNAFATTTEYMKNDKTPEWDYDITGKTTEKW